jgi:hypothetical protein
MNASLSGTNDAVPRSGAREGTWLGVIVATCTWVWLLLIDSIAGEPFQTLDVLGGVIPATIGHFALNILYGIVLVSAVRGSERAPSLIIAFIFGLVMMEVAFAMLAVMLGQAGLGQLTWLRIFGGSLLGLAVALWILSRRYPLADRLRQAEEEL